MELFNNPFYILGATTRDNRSKINELAEEKGLFENSEDYAQARNILTNPSKRLSAEITWFPGVSPQKVELIVKFLTALKEQNKNVGLDIEKFHSIAKLNILKEKLRYHNLNDADGLVALIIAIDNSFEMLDVNHLKTEINEDRIASGFTSIGDMIQVEDELKQVRLDIKKLIDGTLNRCPENQYIQIVNLVAEKCFSNNDIEFGAVLNDLLDSYKLKTKDIIEKKSVDLVSLTKKIINEFGQIELTVMVDHLILQVENFDRLAQPLQLKARSEGTSHDESEQVAWAIRNLAIDLHNKHNATGQSIKLANCLKTAFVELEEFAEKTQEDIEALNNIKQNQQAKKAEQDKMLAENLSDREYSVTVLKDEFLIPPYCTCCMKATENRENINGSISERWGNIKRTRTITLEFPICPHCEKHRKQISSKKWMLVILSIIISFAGFAGMCFTGIPYDTLVIIYAIISAVVYIFIGYIIQLPYISPEHSTWEESVRIRPVSIKEPGINCEFTNWKYAELFANANKSACNVTKNRSRVKSKRLITSLDHPILTYITIMVVVLLAAIFVGPNIHKSSSSNHNTGTVPSNSYSTPSRYEQMNDIEDELNAKKSNIESMEDELARMESDLEYYENMFNQTNDNSYADEYNYLLEDYQSLYDEYDSAINEYNGLVADYNEANGQ